MVLEFIMAYGFGVGAIVKMSEGLPEYERRPLAAISEEKSKGAPDGEITRALMDQENSTVATSKNLSEAQTDTQYHVQESTKAEPGMNPYDQRKDGTDVPREGIVKVVDGSGEGLGDPSSSFEMKPSGTYDIFMDQGYVEDEANFEKWAK
jgi:hypothetical protein